ncbi:uncharacterized protein [Lepeophtheirus salmonis]|uniref:uncharacterized protein n=1 Tax=Lepeophtheirus salmonis TaxID=72036 RepID=UPI001AE64B79|nr:uncharacterized protein LOC121122162 [Lepeophtheirus salmonis]
MNCVTLLLFSIVLCNGEDEEESSGLSSDPCLCILEEVHLQDLNDKILMCRPVYLTINSSLSNISHPMSCSPSRTRFKSIAITSVPNLRIQVLEHLDCRCVDPVHKKSRNKRSPTHSSSDKNNYIPPSKVSFPPRFGNLTTYQTCLACKTQMDFCQEDGKVFDSDVCHCIFPASRTFLNSFYTLGVVMLTIMVCCFLVFGVQKGDENVLSSSRRISSSSNNHRRLSSYRLESGGMPPERSDRIIRPSLTGPSQVNYVNSPVALNKDEFLPIVEPNAKDV